MDVNSHPEQTADLNPHQKQMADESMVRTLRAQTLAIWPQESELIRRYQLAPDIEILDAGCGTGEGTARLAEMFPQARLLGVDVLDEHLTRAREGASRFGQRVTFENQSIYELRPPTGSFDFTV